MERSDAPITERSYWIYEVCQVTYIAWFTCSVRLEYFTSQSNYAEGHGFVFCRWLFAETNWSFLTECKSRDFIALQIMITVSTISVSRELVKMGKIRTRAHVIVVGLDNIVILVSFHLHFFRWKIQSKQPHRSTCLLKSFHLRISSKDIIFQPRQHNRQNRGNDNQRYHEIIAFHIGSFRQGQYMGASKFPRGKKGITR